MNETQVIVNSETANMRLDRALSMLDKSQSRSHYQKLISDGRVFINGKVSLTIKEKVREGDIIAYIPFEEKVTDIPAVDIPLDIVYQDEDVAVINKPVGMVVHPANGHYDDTLVNALLFHIQDLSSINGTIRPGIVHRLDKDTSGLLIIAKNDHAHTFLSNQLVDKSLYREYIALVEGQLPSSEFVVDMPIARSIQDRKKMAVIESGKSAITHVSILSRYQTQTLITCRLETGRTHQIRVHLEAIGHPIVGDPLYNKKGNSFGIKTQLLHARKLGFIHPRTGKQMFFEAEVPTSFQKIIEKLERRKH